jgi:enoyl-CoA hydratase
LTPGHGPDRAAVVVHDDPGGVRSIRLERPDRRNALDTGMVTRLLDAVTAGPPPAALLISGTGPTFCAGIDLGETTGSADDPLRAFFEAVQDLLDAVRESPGLTVAAVRGAAVGAGADLALACDVRIGGPASSFRFPGPQFGVVLGTARLSEIAGPHRALLATTTNRRVSADEALAWGLLSTAAPSDDEIISLAAGLAASAMSLPAGTLSGLIGQARAGTDPRAALRRSLELPGIAARIAAMGGRTPAPVQG